jgi:hypothetical protein
MKDPIFKSTDTELTPEEEQNITARLAAAYQEFDQSTDDPETQSIMRRVEEKLRHASANNSQS